MVEYTAHVEWIRRNIFNVGGSSTGSEGIGKTPEEAERRRHRNREYLQHRRKDCNDSGAEET